jgi:hypothetical protein
MRTRALAWPVGFLGLALATTPASAIQYIAGRITQLEPTYMPDRIGLQMDSTNRAAHPNCVAGNWLWWTNGSAAGGTQNSQAVYATMLAALLSRKKVDFVVDDNDPGCNGRFFHIYAD